MNIMIGDTIVLDDKRIGIVENRSGNDLTVRLPDEGNLRDHIFRSQVKPLAEELFTKPEIMAGQLCLLAPISASRESRHWQNWWPFLATRPDKCGGIHFYKVRRQLERAGIQILSETDRWSRGDKFIVSLLQVPIPVDRDEDNSGEQEIMSINDPVTTNVSLPEPFWPVALVARSAT